MSRGEGGRPAGRHNELAGGLQEFLGVANADELLAQLELLSRRLWTPRGDESGLETFQDIVSTAEARAVLTLLSAHNRRVDPWPAERLADLPLVPEYGWRWEAAAVLVSGTLALGVAEAGPVDDPERLLDTLLHVAFGTDDLTALTRHAVLMGADNNPWPPPSPDADWPQLEAGCLMGIRAAGARLAQSVASSRKAESTFPTVDANGITSLVPTSGSSGDRVSIFGTFPATPRTVLFPRAGGGTMPAILAQQWGTSVLEVLAPEPVGDGPVGFTDGDAGQDPDPSAAIEFADTVAGCLGPELLPIAGRLSGIAPGGLAMQPPSVPTLPGDVNVFHGGPILAAVAPASGTEPGPPVTVTGQNLRSGDTVVLDGRPGRTTFVDAATLTFTPLDIASGNHYLQIRRGYRRSNGLPFDVRATLTQTSPAGRIPPGAYTTLSGTGFGPTTTATVDGLPADVVVPNTHAVEVRTRRPSRPPLATELRGEPVSVEVFDRGVSLGSVTVTLDTFRIASFGDSIVWGQGLLETEKFTMLTADTITSRRGGSIAVFALDRFAHSGARIFPIPGEGSAPSTSPPSLAGECPSPIPSITAQLASPVLAGQAGAIDLVIIDGGINDVDVTTILNPFASDAALSAATGSACRVGMAGLLATVRATFPAAPMVVTGYYPIVSDQSDMAFLLPAIAGLGLLGGLVVPLVAGAAPIGLGPIGTAIFFEWVRQRLIGRSALFASVANAALAVAVAGVPQAALAIPAFGPANSIFAPDSFLFGVGLSVTAGLVPLDPVAGGRVATCVPGSLTTTVASIGHPNPRGARAYADAIAAVLPRLGL